MPVKTFIRYFIILVLFNASIQTAGSQALDMKSQLEFVNYLINTEKAYPEAILKLHELQKTNIPGFQDSLNHLLGWAYYLQKDLDSSGKYLLRVSRNSPVFYKSRFYAQFNLIYSGKLEEASRVINTLKTTDPVFTELKQFQLAAIDLLRDDVTAFDSASFSGNFFSLKEEEKHLVSIYDEMLAFKPKSYFLAGAFSAVIPGLGKIYTGKTGEAVSAFLMLASLGSMTVENYLKDGWNDPKTLLFGGLFSVFYIGNIWGSVVSVKIRREEFYRLKHDEILLDSHIPLRNIFY